LEIIMSGDIESTQGVGESVDCPSIGTSADKAVENVAGRLDCNKRAIVHTFVQYDEDFETVWARVEALRAAGKLADANLGVETDIGVGTVIQSTVYRSLRHYDQDLLSDMLFQLSMMAQDGRLSLKTNDSDHPERTSDSAKCEKGG
jgi:hypothetical protein